MSFSFLVTSKATPPPPQTSMLALSGSNWLAMHLVHLQKVSLFCSTDEEWDAGKGQKSCDTEPQGAPCIMYDGPIHLWHLQVCMATTLRSSYVIECSCEASWLLNNSLRSSLMCKRKPASLQCETVSMSKCKKSVMSTKDVDHT